MSHTLLLQSPGWTPLHLAAQTGHLEVVRLLLAEGANLEALTNVGAVWDGILVASLTGDDSSLRGDCAPSQQTWQLEAGPL